MPPVMPAPKLSPTRPRITAVPPVMYSQPLEPQPSTTTLGAGVAHGEALAGLAGREQLARGRAVEDGVADDGVVLAVERGGRQLAARRWCRRQALADIVVGVAEHFQLHALHREGAERLAGRAAQAHGQVAGLQARSCRTRAVMCAESARADGAVGVAHVVVQLHLLAALEQRLRIVAPSGRRACRAPRCGLRACSSAPGRPGSACDEQRVEVEIVEVRGAAADLVEQVGAADHLVRACGSRARPGSRAPPRR